MRRIALASMHAAIAFALGAGAQPAKAQKASSSPPAADVVVTGRTAADPRREARDFVRDVSPVPIDGQMARWHVPLCVAVSGVAADIAARVASRIRDAARMARARVADESCRANAFVVFTPDAHALLATMERKRPRLLTDVPLVDRRTLRSSKAPVLWWTSTHTEGADGNQLQSIPSVALGVIGSSGPAIPSNDRTRFGDSYRSSMISTALRVTIASATVLVDVRGATGRRLDAVADYAAFVILARVRATPPQATAPTILTLFSADAANPPRGLTVFDRAYLSALYAVPADRSADAQARSISGAIVRAAAVPDD